MNDLDYLQLAVGQARESLKQGGFPAGAVLVKDRKILAQGISIGNLLHDPTAHAESVTVRAACKALASTDLRGATLYASFEPCVMCFHSANWAGVSRLVYGCRKAIEMVSKRCYEGTTAIEEANRNNTHQIELVYLADFEAEMLQLLAEWERSFP